MNLRLNRLRSLICGCATQGALLLPGVAFAQVPPANNGYGTMQWSTAPAGGTTNYGTYNGPYPVTNPTPTYRVRRTRSANEMAFLYATSAVYGVGLGVEVSSELKTDDPGLFLIAPALLGVAAPIGAYALDQPKMRRGVPTAISAGLLLGAGEGLGIAGLQMVTANDSDSWRFRGLSRAMALSATIGGVGGWLAGEWLEPPPNTVVLTMSGALWGTAVGSMLGYGASSGDWGRSNDKAALGGLIGYNVGALGAASVGFTNLVSDTQLLWMWSGAGIGAAVSLPIFLLYAGDDSPPARRGFIFMGTATTLGIVAGGIFAPAGRTSASREIVPTLASNRVFSLTGVFPFLNDHQAGLVATGMLN